MSKKTSIEEPFKANKMVPVWVAPAKVHTFQFTQHTNMLSLGSFQKDLVKPGLGKMAAEWGKHRNQVMGGGLHIKAKAEPNFPAKWAGSKQQHGQQRSLLLSGQASCTSCLEIYRYI